MDDQFQTDLESWLDATTDRYVVERTLKATQSESTQVVYRKDERGRRGVGPFVRKCFTDGTGRGSAYEKILSAQTQNRRLEHQPIIYDFEHVGDRLEVVMEYVQGPTLRERAATEGAGPQLASKVMPQLCDAVSELHERFDRPIIHRDIKPTNVMFRGEQLLLIDLGIARTYDEGATRDTVRYGTPGYAPPEQFGYGQTSVRSDVYALGMTLAFCLTGQDPTNELREREFVHARIPKRLRPVLVRATQFDPEQRYASVRELQEATLAALEDAPESVRSAGGGESRPMPKRPSLWDRVPNLLGRLWNLVVVFLWAVMMAALVTAPLREESAAKNVPFWFLPLAMFTLTEVPVTCLAYLLLDKRRLRKRLPFLRYTFRRELVFCVLLCLSSALFTFFVFFVLRFLQGQ